MDHESTARVGDLVRADFRAAAVFEKYSIDFCCNGGQSLAAACTERNIDPSLVLHDLAQVHQQQADGQFRPDEWELDVLSDFIVNNHHRYVRRMLPVIVPHIEKVVSVHAARYPWLVQIQEYVHAIAAELSNHMHKEENVLFPYIKMLAMADREGRPVPPAPFGTIRNPIRMMEEEHSRAGDALSAIRRTTSNFTLPADACTTFSVTYKELEEFERDLHRHIHLENNILFPKAIALEERLTSRP